MNAIQNSIRTSEKVKAVSCYCKLSDLVPHLRRLAESKLTVSANPEHLPVAPSLTTMNAGFAVLMYVNR